MSIYDQLREVLAPHANSLNKTIATTGMLIHNKLDLIEKATNVSRADVGEKWFRISFNKELEKGEEVELAECPMNEVWSVEAITVDGVINKSAAFTITVNNSNGHLLFSVIKEGIGTETVGGDMVVQKGESIILNGRTEKTRVKFTLHLTRRKIPIVQRSYTSGEPQGALEPVNVHETNRDVIASPTGQYQENPPETIEVGT